MIQLVIPEAANGAAQSADPLAWNDGFGPITSAAAQTARWFTPTGSIRRTIGVRRKKFSSNKPARKTKLLSRFNKSTRRANHPKTLSSPFRKNISLSPSGKSLI